MLEKLGLMKVKEHLEIMNVVRDESNKTIEELRAFIERLELVNETLREDNLKSKVCEAQNFKLKNDITKLKKEIGHLEKAIEKTIGERFDMAISLSSLFRDESRVKIYKRLQKKGNK